MRVSVRPLLGLVVALSTGSCLLSDSTGVGNHASPVGVFVQPAVIPSAADATALPINRIRALAVRDGDGAVLADVLFTVSPSDAEWEIELDVPVGGREVVAVVHLHLLNEADDGTGEIQYSGRTEPMTIRPGQAVEPPDVPLVRGPPENLLVTGVTITSVPTTIAEGESEALEATVTTEGSVTPTLFWTSLDETLATIDEATVTAVDIGEVEVVASAGAFADTASIQVLPVDDGEPGGGAPVVTWTNEAGGNWSTGANWSTGSPPVPGDSAVIDLAGVYTVTVDQNVDVASIVVGAPGSSISIVHDANTVTVGDAVVVEEDGIYALGGTGTLTGSGDIVVDNAVFDWSGGTISGDGLLDVTSGGGFLVGGAAQKSLDTRDLLIGGSMTWTGTGGILHSGGPTVTVAPSGTMTVNAETAFAGGTTAILVNQGTIERTALAGGAGFGNVALSNSGTVDVQAGALTFSDPTAAGSSDGSFLVADGALLGLGAGTLTSSAMISGGGTVALQDGSGSTDVAGSVSADTVAVTAQGTTVSFTGNYDVGATLLAADGTVAFDTPGPALTDDLMIGAGTLDGTASFVVRDTLVWVAGALAGAGTLVLDPGSYGQVGPTTVASTKPVTVAGTLEIAAGGTLDQDGLFILDATGLLQGEGTLDLTDGTIELWAGETGPGASPGQLAVVAPTGGLTMGQTSTTTLEIEGTVPGTGHDVLDLEGDITLGGDLTVLDTTAFTPSVGQAFVVATVTGTRNGDFGSVTLPSVPGSALTSGWIVGQGNEELLVVTASDAPLLFSSDRAGNDVRDIWAGTLDGQGASRVTTTLEDDFGARWSPDGSRIVFTRDDGNLTQIWIMGADGSSPQRLSDGQSDERDPHWSPDGSEIVFTRNDGVSDDVWRAPVDDWAAAIQLTNEPDSDERQPAWSPDGAEILFVTTSQGNEDIWTMSSDDGSGQSEVTTSPADEYDPRWAPQGRIFAFTRGPVGNEEISTFNLGTGGEIQLTTNAVTDRAPTYSPDGTLIYFASDRDGDLEIWQMDAQQGSNPTVVTDDPATDDGPDIRN